MYPMVINFLEFLAFLRFFFQNWKNHPKLNFQFLKTECQEEVHHIDVISIIHTKFIVKVKLNFFTTHQSITYFDFFTLFWPPIVSRKMGYLISYFLGVSYPLSFFFWAPFPSWHKVKTTYHPLNLVNRNYVSFLFQP